MLVQASRVAEIVEEAIPSLAFDLPPDVLRALILARENESSQMACAVLDHLIENARIAADDRVPLCQDTGSVWLCLEIGPGVTIDGDVFSLVNAAVERAYTQSGLRMSIVSDPLFKRENTGNNTPAFCEISFSEHAGARLHIMLKGGGSDNASSLFMLPPAAGKQAVVESIIHCVEEKAANACAPVILGVGIGSTFDKVGTLAKKALLRSIGDVNPDPSLAALEEELLNLVNKSGVGPGGLGGKTSALAVMINTAPCHIAALPLAINMGCSAMRRCTIEL